jgi:hypothetical protein
MSIRLIFIFSNGLLFYLQNITEHDLRGSLFEGEKERRFWSTKEISQPIGSDISLVMSMLGRFIKLWFFYDANSTFIRLTKSLISIGLRMKQPTSKLGKISLNAS